MGQAVENLGQLFDKIEETSEGKDKVSLGEILDAVGSRSFGPMLLVAGIVTLAPVVGDIPGVPTLMGMVVLLIAGQLLFHRDHIWLPNWLLNRSAPRDKLMKALGWMRSPARFIDKLLRPRLTMLAQGFGVYIIATACLLVAIAAPPMELVPFSANAAGAALTAFGLGLMAKDGILILLSYTILAATIGLVLYHFLGG